MLKFPNVETLDNTVNNQLLNEYRDRVCTVKDVELTFKHIYKDKAKNNTIWRDEYNYLFLTIKRLRKRGCNVRQLERTFNKYEKRLKLNGCN